MKNWIEENKILILAVVILFCMVGAGAAEKNIYRRCGIR